MRRRGRERTCLSAFPTDRQNIPHHVTKFWLIPLSAVKSRFLLKFLRFSHIPPHILAKSRIPKVPFQTLMQGRGARHLKTYKALIV